MLFYNNFIKKTYLIRNNTIYSQNKCYMHRSRCLASKNTFHLLERFCDQTVLDNITHLNHGSLIKSLVDHCFEPNEGIIQHKYTLIHSIIRQKYKTEFLIQNYQQRVPETAVTIVPNIMIDLRILGELPVISRYEQHFKKDIKNILLTGDSIFTTYEKQKQSCPDMIVNLLSPYGNKNIYQDIKSGMNMIKHSSRGSLGVITLDADQKLIPFTTHDLNIQEINEKSIKNIANGLKYDNIHNDLFDRILNKCSEILKTQKDNIQANDQIQLLLWDNFQCNPLYKRSIAFTFVERQSVISFNDKKHIYEKKFVSLLSERTYDPNKISDRKEIYKAMLLAYREVEPQLAIKLNHLIKASSIEIDSHFLHILGSLIKQTLI